MLRGRYGSFAEVVADVPGRTIAIGAFDGVHLGHQAIIGRALALARERGVPAMVMTFDPLPIAVLRPQLKTVALTSLAQKAELVAALGVDELLVLPFTRALAHVRWDRFAAMLALPPLHAAAVVVGENFRFGHRGTGTAAMLADYGLRHDLAVEVPPTVASPDGKPISSTRVRRLVSQGQVGQAARLLGRAPTLDGVVVPGDRRGEALGFPTANVEVPAGLALPGRGVYAGAAVVGSERHTAAINVGTAPTFTDAGAPLRLEAFLLDYPGGELYGREVRLEFVERLRDERRFASADQLVEQVREDVRRTRELVAS